MAREKVQSLRERSSQSVEKPSMAAVLQYYDVEFRADVVGWQSLKCPVVAEDNPSFRINLETGGYICLSCGVQGGDSLALIMARDNLSFPEAKALGESMPGERDSTTVTPGRRSVSVRAAGYKPRYRRR